MEKSKIQILIVEDDPTQGAALNELFKRAGYQTTFCISSAQALTAVQRMEFHCLIVDCMLPKMNGVDLIEEIQKVVRSKAKVIMHSGIFKDKNFIKETMARTEALAFFTKPLPFDDVLKEVEKAFEGFEAPSELGLWSLYSSNHLSGEQLVELLGRVPTFPAFHLPMLYQRMQETELSGEMSLTSAVGEPSSVRFFEGQIFSATTPDKESYFGALAIGLGYVPPEEVLSALNDSSKKKLGQKLIDSQVLSPHAIQVILEEQLAMRISQTVQDGVVTVEWQTGTFPEPQSNLNGARFEALIQAWLASKIDSTWIKSALELWGQHKIEGEIDPKFGDATVVEQVLKHPSFDGASDATTLFLRLMEGTVFIGQPESSETDFTYFESRLDKMLAQFKMQNHFQILGVGEKSQTLEVNKAFQGLKLFFDPEKLPETCPPTVREKCERLFEQIKSSHLALSDEARRTHYAAGLAKLRTQEVLNCGSMFQAAIADLQTGNSLEAAKKFQSILDKKIEIKDLRAYRIWAGLKCDPAYAELQLEHIPPEDRHSAAYQMAKGVRYRNKSLYSKSLQAFRTAHVLDPKLSIAKRELQQLLIDVQRTRPDDRHMIKEINLSLANLYGKNARKAS